MLDKRISKKVRLKNIDKTRKCLIEKSKTTWFINEYKTQKSLHSFKLYWTNPKFSFYHHFGFYGYVSISAFALLDGIPIGIASSAVRLKNCVITTGIKKQSQ